MLDQYYADNADNSVLLKAISYTSLVFIKLRYATSLMHKFC